MYVIWVIGAVERKQGVQYMLYVRTDVPAAVKRQRRVLRPALRAVVRAVGAMVVVGVEHAG